MRYLQGLQKVVSLTVVLVTSWRCTTLCSASCLSSRLELSTLAVGRRFVWKHYVDRFVRLSDDLHCCVGYHEGTEPESNL